MGLILRLHPCSAHPRLAIKGQGSFSSAINDQFQKWAQSHFAMIMVTGVSTTVAEKDTAAAAKAALGPPESRRWPPKGRPSAAAGRRGSAAPANYLKSIFGSRMVNWTTLGHHS